MKYKDLIKNGLCLFTLPLFVACGDGMEGLGKSSSSNGDAAIPSTGLEVNKKQKSETLMRISEKLVGQIGLSQGVSDGATGLQEERGFTNLTSSFSNLNRSISLDKDFTKDCPKGGSVTVNSRGNADVNINLPESVDGTLESLTASARLDDCSFEFLLENSEVPVSCTISGTVNLSEASGHAEAHRINSNLYDVFAEYSGSVAGDLDIQCSDQDISIGACQFDLDIVGDLEGEVQLSPQAGELEINALVTGSACDQTVNTVIEETLQF